MTLVPLKFLSESKLAELRRNVEVNLPRYQSGDFLDLERDNGWAIESGTVKVDIAQLTRLDGTERSAQADCKNSVILYGALLGMTPALAYEERVWARLTHVEALAYGRARWLSPGEHLMRDVSTHMFAAGRTGIRDDNALSRLWWNMHIATLADPDDPTGALSLILKRADIRMQLVERTWTSSRLPLAQAILRAMRRDEWITSSEDTFRKFMIAVNKYGGGVLFEALSEEDIDALIEQCAGRARAAIGA